MVFIPSRQSDGDLMKLVPHIEAKICYLECFNRYVSAALLGRGQGYEAPLAFTELSFRQIFFTLDRLHQNEGTIHK